MKKYLLILFWLGLSLAGFGQSSELVGTFSVVSSTGSDPTLTVVGNFNSTVGFLPSAVDTGDILLVRQVFAGNHRRKLYRITGISGNSPLTLNVTLINGTTGGPFPAGTHAIIRESDHGSLYDVPNVSQEIESYINNYTINNLESMDLDTVEERNDSLFAILNNGTEYYVGPTAATAIDTSYQVGDSIYVVSAGDTIFTGIAYANPEIDTIYNDGTNYYMVTVEGDTIEIGSVAQVTANGAHPVNPPTYLVHIDTLGTDTIYFDNNGVWTRFNVGGTQIGAPFFVALNDAVTTFHPAGVPPVGAIIWNPFMGEFMRKFGVTIIDEISMPNGRLVEEAQRHFQFTTLNTWDLNKRSSATLGFQVGIDGVIAVPLNLDTQERGSERTIVLNNTTGSPRTVTFSSTRYRTPDGLTPLGAMAVPEFSDMTLSFTIDANDSEVIMRLNSSTQSATTYTFVDSANGHDLINTSGTVTSAPDITELTFAAVVGADSIMMWDASANAHRRTSVTDIVALASAGTVTVTDQVNGLDIVLTGSNITINNDYGEVANAVIAAGDSVLIYDVSVPGYRRVSAQSIADLFSATADAGYWKLGGQALPANANIGSTNAFRVGVTTNGSARMYFSSDGRIFTPSGNVTDFNVEASDSIKVAGTSIDLAGATKITGNETVTGNITTAAGAVSARNGLFANALRMGYQSYTASGTLGNKMANYIDGTADHDLTTSTSLPDSSIFFVKNLDAVFKARIVPGAGFTLNGADIVPAGTTGWFQRKGTVIERLTDGSTEFTYRAVISTNVNGQYILNHPFGTATIKHWDINTLNEGQATVWTAKSYSNGNILFQQWGMDGLVLQTINIDTVFTVKI
jgi:hypothetical protein